MGVAGKAAVIVAAFIFTAITLLASPIFILPYVVPPLSGLLPRPPIVAKGAAAQYDWKGAGAVVWKWCDDIAGGSVHWSASRDNVSISLVGRPVCRTFDPSYYNKPWDVLFWMGDKELLFKGAETSGWSGAGVPCGFQLPPERLAFYRRQVREAQASTTNERQLLALAEMVRQLQNTDGMALTADTSSDVCSNGPRWRIEHP
ncbi:MAG: hypothetical protein ACK56C_11545 [Alphaproteobacteria bacterium]